MLEQVGAILEHAIQGCGRGWEKVPRGVALAKPDDDVELGIRSGQGSVPAGRFARSEAGGTTEGKAREHERGELL